MPIPSTSITTNRFVSPQIRELAPHELRPALADRVLFEPGYQFQPHDVLFLDQRPGEDEVNRYEIRIREGLNDANQSPLSESVHPDILALTKPPLSERIQHSLLNDEYFDTTRVRAWLALASANSGLPEMESSPFRLVWANADSHISDVMDSLHHGLPGGWVLSGSRKNVDETYLTDTAVQKTLELIQTLTQKELPLLAICFGMQMCSYALFGTLPEYLRVPEGASHEIFTKADGSSLFVPVREKGRRMVYGTSDVAVINGNSNHHFYGAKKIRSMEVHSQYVDATNIPSEALLASSTRVFQGQDDDHTIEQRIAEAIKIGPYSLGVQGHPEFSPQMLLVTSYLKRRMRKFLQEGHPISEMREYLENYHEAGSVEEGYAAAQLPGLNWAQYSLLSHYLFRTLERPEITEDKKETVYDSLTRLLGQNPDLVDVYSQELKISLRATQSKEDQVLAIMAKLQKKSLRAVKKLVSEAGIQNKEQDDNVIDFQDVAQILLAA